MLNTLRLSAPISGLGAAHLANSEVRSTASRITPEEWCLQFKKSRICARLCQERARGARCCTRDEGGPFGAGLQEQASNSRELLPSNGGGGGRRGTAPRRTPHVRGRVSDARTSELRARASSSAAVAS